MEHPLFEIVTTRMGVISIRNKAVNEIMHNPVGPWVEANALYIDQSGLKERLSEPTLDELVLFDVGLGAAANALAALACFRSLGETARPFKIISFERDLDLLRFALAHADQFEHFRGFEEALQTLLDQRKWTDGKIHWELREGNFLDLIDNEIELPHVIFFDPYSPKVNNEMWTLSCFKKIHQKSRTIEQGGTSLFTYSQATKIRVALFVAGFDVGYGQATGAKEETTVATTDRRLLKDPVGPEWFSRWRKSHDRYPYDCAEDQRPIMDAVIETHALKNQTTIVQS